MAQLNVVTLVPARHDGGHRDRLWQFAREWWERDHPSYPIFEGFHTDGPFNRSAAVNTASRLADEAVGRWDVALIIDRDIIANPEAVRRIVSVARETGRMAVSHTKRVMLNEAMTRRVLAGHRGSWHAPGQKIWTDSCSCCIAVPRELWDQIGGFDEEYVGWGYEDSAFGALAIHHGGPIHFEPSELFHLWHPVSREATARSATRIANEKRLRALHAHLRAEAEARAGQTIPRILHRTVPAETTAEVEAWWDRFAELHPDWDLRTYRDPIDPSLFPRTSPLWSKCKNGAQKAGLIRLEALVTWGGVYVDSDVEPFRAFDPLLLNQAFCGWEDETTVPDAVLACRPLHPAFEECLDLAIQRVRRGQDAWSSGPGVTTKVLPNRFDVLTLPPGALYPYHYLQKAERPNASAAKMPWAFCAHHWHGSWLSDAQRNSIESRQQ
jgi:hypothetical protein